VTVIVVAVESPLSPLTLYSHVGGHEAPVHATLQPLVHDVSETGPASSTAVASQIEAPVTSSFTVSTGGRICTTLHSPVATLIPVLLCPLVPVPDDEVVECPTAPSLPPSC
jgi:hypothetical protein